MSIWCNEEIVNLLEWMRNYNIGKPHERQIRVYGMDNQFGGDLSNRLRTYVEKHNIAINDSLLAIADSCSAAKLKAGGLKGWDRLVMPKLRQIKPILERDKENLIAVNACEYYDMIRALEHLEQYTAFISAPYSHARDKDMYENVLKILELEQPNSKAFVWAHNEHINKKQYGSYNVKSLGTHLKNHFKEAYYAVGFDFGVGVLKGYEIKNGQATKSVLRNLDKPYHKTFAETLVKARGDIYFIDMEEAGTNTAAAKFFGSKKQQLFIGGPGFDPDSKIMFKRRYSDSYDGIIFVKTISPATYKK
jgi:erythromycin esterase